MPHPATYSRIVKREAYKVPPGIIGAVSAIVFLLLFGIGMAGFYGIRKKKQPQAKELDVREDSH